MATFDELKAAVMDMEVEEAVKLTQKALDEGKEAEEILNQALVLAMDVVGDQYDSGDRFVPEMLLSANAMKESVGLLRPLLAESGVKMKGKIIIGTVEGDLHDIGQNLVSMMLEGSGYEVVNLGSETPADEFAKAVKEHEPDIVGLSAMLTTTMLHMPEVIDALKEAGLKDKVTVMIGGAPVTQEYADEIGADGYAPDAGAASKLADTLMQG